MELKKIKKIVVGATATALAMTPIGLYMLLYRQNFKMAKFLEKYYSNGGSASPIYVPTGANADLTYPTSPEEYEKWVTIADIEKVEQFNNVLADIKLDGTLSDAFLQTQGYESTEAFVAFLTSLYEAGKSGDVDAQEQFNSLYQEYQNDFFNQAVEQLGDGIGATEADFVPATMDGGIFADLTPETFYFIAGGVVIGASIAMVVYNFLEKKEAREKRRIEREAKEKQMGYSK